MSVVTSHPDILGGTPCFAGTRVPADTLFTYLGRGYTLDYFLQQFPAVTREQATALLEEASREMTDSARRSMTPPRKAAG